MATYAAGMTVTWGGTSFQEVTELKYSHGGGLPISRGTTVAANRPFALDLGTIDITCLGTANCTLLNYGKRSTFAVMISTASTLFTHKAIFERLSVEDKVNDVRRHTVTLRFAPE